MSKLTTDFLQGKCVYVPTPALSVIVQRVAFSFGYRWLSSSGGVEVKYTSEPVICFDGMGSGALSYFPTLESALGRGKAFIDIVEFMKHHHEISTLSVPSLDYSLEWDTERLRVGCQTIRHEDAIKIANWILDNSQVTKKED